MTTPDESPVPAGWVRLQVACDGDRWMIVPASRVRDEWMSNPRFTAFENDQAYVLGTYVKHTWAEVAALIAAAEAAERRAKALPVMAALLQTKLQGNEAFVVEISVSLAAAILDAIERREGA